MSKKIIATSIILLANTSLASADTLIPYLGAELGYDTGTWKLHDINNNTVNMSESGVLGGLFGGMGWTLSDRFYLGLEVFGDQSSVVTQKATVSTTTQNATNYVRMRYNYGASVLPGIRITDSSLAYLRLGGVVARFSLHQTVPPSTATSNWYSSIAGGGQAGIGAQTAIGGNWMVRGEYVYSRYNSFTAFGNNIRARDNQFKVGIFYNLT